jgi:hypothetical protein
MMVLLTDTTEADTPPSSLSFVLEVVIEVELLAVDWIA